MNQRTLSEIAYDTYWFEGENLPDDIVTKALKEAGIDPGDDRERIRFRKLVVASRPQQQLDRLSASRYAAEAERICGPDAPIEKLIVIAEHLEEVYQGEAKRTS